MKQKNKKMNRKAQEEIVGFVLIVLIVAIIFVILLSIFIRQQEPTTQKESLDVFHYLRSMMEYTTNCSISYGGEFSSLGDLIKDCYDEENCENSGENPCELLKRTIEGSVKSNWNINENGTNKGYLFNSTYLSSSKSEEIVSIGEGNCSSNKFGAETFLPAYFGGEITISLEICN